MKQFVLKRACTRWVRLQYIKLVRLNDTPEKIARGLALGVVIGIFPTFGLGVILALFLAGPLKVNKVAAVLGTLVMNPWTSPIFWALSYLVGSVVVGNNLHEIAANLKELTANKDIIGKVVGREVLFPYIVGNVIVTAAAAAVSYVGGFQAVRLYRNARVKRLKKKSQHIENK